MKSLSETCLRIAAEGDGDVLSGEAAQQHRRHEGAVAEGLVEEVAHLVDQVQENRQIHTHRGCALSHR